MRKKMEAPRRKANFKFEIDVSADNHHPDSGSTPARLNVLTM